MNANATICQTQVHATWTKTANKKRTDAYDSQLPDQRLNFELSQFTHSTLAKCLRPLDLALQTLIDTPQVKSTAPVATNAEKNGLVSTVSTLYRLIFDGGSPMVGSLLMLYWRPADLWT